MTEMTVGEGSTSLNNTIEASVGNIGFPGLYAAQDRKVKWQKARGLWDTIGAA